MCECICVATPSAEGVCIFFFCSSKRGFVVLCQYFIFIWSLTGSLSEASVYDLGERKNKASVDAHTASRTME